MSFLSIQDSTEPNPSDAKIVLKALSEMKEPATVKDVVEKTAIEHDLNADEIRKPIGDELTIGFKSGFLNKIGQKCTTEPVDKNRRRRSKSRRRAKKSRSKKSRSRSRSRSGSRKRS